MRSVSVRGKKKATNKYTGFLKMAKMKGKSNINGEMWDIPMVEDAINEERKIESEA
jgi:hypothetical protein